MTMDVLLADRSPVLAAAYEAFLVAEGFRVVSVTNGLACLQQLRRDPPRLLVLDPHLLWGGPGVLALISEQDDLPPIPVLVLSEHPADDIIDLVPPHPSAVVLKPIAPATLAALVKSLLLPRIPDHSFDKPIHLTSGA